MLMPVTPIVGPYCRDLVYMSHTPTLARMTITTETNLPKWTYETCTNGQSLSVVLTVTIHYGHERYRAVVAKVSVHAHSDFSECAGRRTAYPGQSGENYAFHLDLVHARNRFKSVRERGSCKFRQENRANIRVFVVVDYLYSTAITQRIKSLSHNLLKCSLRP